MRDVVIAIVPSFHGTNEDGLVRAQKLIEQLLNKYGERLCINLISQHTDVDKSDIQYDFVKKISVKHNKFIFIDYPLIILYKIFSWCSPIRKLLMKNKIIKAYKEADLVIDESFEDKSGYVKGTYASVSSSVPKMLCIPIVRCIWEKGDIKDSYNIYNSIDNIMEKPYKISKSLDYKKPELYMGNYIACRKGYAMEQGVRDYAASGGMVTALLCNMLKNGDINGAWVTKTKFVNSELTYDTYIATTEEEIRDAATSVYMDIPLLKHIDLLEEFEGKVAVVMTPCMMNGLTKILERKPQLKKKVVLKLGLYCSGSHDKKATTLSMKKAGVTAENATRLYYRRGHWRGMSSIVYNDGNEKTFSYTKLLCAYKNAYFFEKNSCMHCTNHFAETSDISFGDVWLKEMKKLDKKHTSCVIRNEKALQYFNQATADGAITASHIRSSDMIRSQKRALVFKYKCADTKNKRKWNHKLAYYLAEKNKKFSIEHYDKLAKIPSGAIYYYMCFIRVLLSW